MTPADIKTAVRGYLIAEHFPGEDPARLSDEQPLISSRLVDSIGSLRLVGFLEERFGISVAPHEADTDNLDSIERIARYVTGKLAAR